MLYLIGLGLCDPSDITVKGLDVVKKATRVYLEAYTSILTASSKQDLENYYGRDVIVADRELVEQNSDSLTGSSSYDNTQHKTFQLPVGLDLELSVANDDILRDADCSDVAFLVVGDPLGATTHSDLIIRAAELGITYRIIHNASIINAVGACGLQLYHFGETVSIPFWTDSWKPDSFVDKIESNLQRGLHTLCLLDIKVKEQTIENLMRGRKVYNPPRYMSVEEATFQLKEAIDSRNSCTENPLTCLTVESRCIGLARVGSSAQCIAEGTIGSMGEWDLGDPLHSLVIIGSLHPLEEKMIKLACNAKKRP